MNIVNFRQQIAKLCIIFLGLCLIPATSVDAQDVVKIQNQAQQAGKCLSQPFDKSNECQQAQTIQIQSAQSVFGTPLSFYVNDDTSTAMYYNGVQQFYGGNAEGVFIWVNGAVYGPGRVPAGQTTNAYTWVSNSLSGTGSSGDPWRATTLVDVGNSGLRLQQEIRYANGESYVTYSWRVSNTATNSITYTLFHAADLWTDNNDNGYGYYDSLTGAIGGYNGSHTFYQYFQPITVASHHFEGHYSDTWQRIGSIAGQGLGFDDTYLPNNYIDNSAGLQWNRTLSPNSVDIISDYGVFNTQIGGITCYSLNLTYNSSRGNVLPTPAENCPTGPGYTYNTTVTLKAVAANGYQFTGWEGDASGTSAIANVAITGDVAVTANFQSLQQKPVVVLVHGWHGLPPFLSHSTDICRTSQGNYLAPYRVTNPSSLPSFYDFGSFAPHLLEDGWDVWIAHVETGPAGTGTPRVQYNAACLQQQLSYVRGQTKVGKVILIAHSMGGLVSRAYVEDDSLYNNDVSQLITLGTPHAGTPYGLGFCLYNLMLPDEKEDKAACQFSLGGAGHIGEFNSIYSIREQDVIYDFIGGNKTPFGLAGPILRYLGTEGPNDGVVGAQSGIGRIFWPTGAPTEFVDVGNGGTRHLIPASHSGLEFATFAFPQFDWQQMRPLWIPYSAGFQQWFPSYFHTDVGDPISATSSYQCVLNLLDIRSENHRNNARGSCPSEATIASSQHEISTEMTSSVSQTPAVSDHIANGQDATQIVPIDSTGFAEFNLSWNDGVLGFVLTNPLGQVINPAYAANHPNEVTYRENMDPASPLFASYDLISPLPGQYTIHITGNEVGGNGTDYGFYALVDSERTLTVTTDKPLYSIGNPVLITATMRRAGVSLSGATIHAIINRPGFVSDIVTLNDLGDGVYQGLYTLPNTSGYFALSVIANGIDDGAEYARQVDTLLAVSPPTVQLTGTYSDSPIDDDNNGKYEALAVDVGLEVAQAGDYLVSGDLVSGNLLVAHYVGSSTFINPGIDTVTMLFNGDDVRRSSTDGPYTLTNLTIEDPQNGDLPAIWQASNVWTTAAYDYQELAATCFVLNLATNLPAGGMITPNPAPNCNGGLQYTSDSEVTLTVASNSGYHFTGWSGDISGSVNPASITINADKSVIANFTNTASQRFGDVPSSYWASNFIERLATAGITGGCNLNPPQYCPEGTVTRAQMAVFLERGIHGSSYNPPAVGGATGFDDVLPVYWAAAWIKQLATEGITGGCGSGNYCPEIPVTRAQMAIFLLRAKHGSSYSPPAAGGSTGFSDVSPTYWAGAWIKQLVAEGITAGCGNGSYCPESPVTRAQMAVFLVRTFNLP